MTAGQAREAICFDFRQYGPQILLFSEILPLISNGKIVAKKNTEKNGIWISEPGRKKMRWLEGQNLLKTMCAAISSADLTPGLLQSVCARVFHARAVIGVDPETNQAGVFIDTGMEGFVCRQCGQCCQNLDYRAEVKAADVARWRELERFDILQWVGEFKTENRETVYRIWTMPGTRQFAETCPFLTKIPNENRRICSIHDVKPEICRNYPVSRKHARMTGCPGFDKPPSSKQ